MCPAALWHIRPATTGKSSTGKLRSGPAELRDPYVAHATEWSDLRYWSIQQFVAQCSYASRWDILTRKIASSCACRLRCLEQPTGVLPTRLVMDDGCSSHDGNGGGVFCCWESILMGILRLKGSLFVWHAQWLQAQGLFSFIHDSSDDWSDGWWYDKETCLNGTDQALTMHILVCFIAHWLATSSLVVRLSVVREILSPRWSHY